jgi:hypothetical protein
MCSSRVEGYAARAGRKEDGGVAAVESEDEDEDDDDEKEDK